MSQPTRTALVTGASRGIGRAIALRLARDGFAVIINYAGNTAAAEETVQQIEAAGGRALAIAADVSTPDGVAMLFRRGIETYGGIDVVVHNAGIMAMAPIAADQLEVFDRTIAVNLRSTFLMMAQAGSTLGDGGRFVALSSSVLGKNLPGYGPYIASKAGVEGLMRVFANELRGRGIRVNAVAPGPVGTELFFHGKSPETIEQIAQFAPLGRIGEPEEIAGAVAFLAGPDGAWVNGQVLRVNGGMV